MLETYTEYIKDITYRKYKNLKYKTSDCNLNS